MRSWRALLFAFVAVCSFQVGWIRADDLPREPVDPAPLKVKFVGCQGGSPYGGRPVTAQIHHKDGEAFCTEVNLTTGLDGSAQFVCDDGTQQYSCDYWTITLWVTPSTPLGYRFKRVSHNQGYDCYEISWINEWVDDIIFGNCGTSFDEGTGFWIVRVAPPAGGGM